TDPERLAPSVRKALPFVEAGSRDEAAAIAQRGPEGRLLGKALDAPVDEQAERGRVAHPGRHQPPAHQLQAALPVPLRDHRDRLGWRDIVARRELGRAGAAEDRLDLLDLADEPVSTAHDRIPARSGWNRVRTGPVSRPAGKKTRLTK